MSDHRQNKTQPYNWSDARVEQLRSWRQAGLSGSAIAARLGISRNAVIGKCHREGFISRNIEGGWMQPTSPSAIIKARRANVWTDARLKVLRRMVGENKSATEIAAELGPEVSPYMIAGKARSENLTFTAHKRSPQLKMPFRATNIRLAYAPPAVAFEVPRVVISNGRSDILANLARNDCRWVVESGATGDLHVMCGATQREGSAYCADHHRLTVITRATRTPKMIAFEIERRARAKYAQTFVR